MADRSFVRNDYVIVASSLHLVRQRTVLEDALRAGVASFGIGQTISPRSFEIEFEAAPTDQRRSAQESLQFFDDPRWRGVMCVIGEWLGHPMHADFDPEMLARLADWSDPAQPYRLVHPWPAGHDARQEALRAGGFPLTGTTLEFLSSLAAGKPTFVALLADKEITCADRKAILNGRQLRLSKLGEFGDDEQYDAWIRESYQPQTEAVRNFMCAIALRNISQNPVSNDEDLGRLAEGWVARYLLLSEIPTTNPYRHLGYFDVADGRHFFGRDDLRNRGVALLDEGMDRADVPASLCILGVSGCGKSSFLRAGILHEFTAPDRRKRFPVVVFRPADTWASNGMQWPAIAALLNSIAAQTDLPISLKDMQSVMNASGAAAVQCAVDLLRGLLDEDGRGRKLVIGIDQFEEIVDLFAQTDGSDPSARNFWWPLINLCHELAKLNLSAVVFTLESARRKALAAARFGDTFDLDRRPHLSIDDDRRIFFQEIIEKPFRVAKYHLAPSVVERLLGEVDKLAAHGHDAERLSALPLLALKLSQLFEFVDGRFPQIEADRLYRLAPELADSGYIRAADLGGEHGFDYSIEKEIDRLATAAWSRKSGSRALDMNELGHFLLPFIEISAEGGERLRLKTVAEPALKASRDLYESFHRSRLLVRMGNRYRLVHEAMIRNWTAGRKWLEARRAYLTTERRMRAHAGVWSAEGRPEIATASPQEVRDVTAILGAHVRSWAPSGQDPEAKDSELRSYCLALFQHAADSREEVEGRTAIEIAAAYNMVALIERFLAANPDSIEHMSPAWQRTPLFNASWDNPEMVRLLLAHNANPRHRDKDGYSPLSCAIWGGNVECFELLLDACGGELPDIVLHDCAATNQRFMAERIVNRKLRDPRAELPNRGLPIHQAAMYGALDTFRYFLRFNDPLATIHGSHCLHIAAQNGQRAILEELLGDQRAHGRVQDANDDGFNPLHLAANAHCADLIPLLLPAIEPNCRGGAGGRYTPLSLALVDQSSAAQGLVHEEDVLATVNALLADPRTALAPGSDGLVSPLTLAHAFPRVERRLLLDERIDPLAPYGDGEEVPLALAAKRGHWDIVRRMIQRILDDPALRIRAADTSLLPEMAAAKALREDLVEAIFELWPPTPELAEMVLPSALAAKNFLFALRLFRSIERPPDNGFPLLWAAVSARAPLDIVARILTLAPRAWSDRSAAGWTALHRLCASQDADRIVDYLPEIPPEAWQVPDPAGRLPADLMMQARRAPLGDVPASGWVWPAPGAWDKRCTWTALSAEDRLEVSTSVSPIDGRLTLTEETRIDETRLSFYPDDVRLLRFADPHWPEGLKAYILEKERRRYRLNGLSLPIHQMNELAPIRIAEAGAGAGAEEAAADYLCFFCFFVRGDDGPFLVLEKPDQEGLPEGLPDDEQAYLERLTAPVFLEPDRASPGSYWALANIMYGAAIFHSAFKLKPDGTIEMLEDDPLTPDLSSAPHAPLAIDVSG